MMVEAKGKNFDFGRSRSLKNAQACGFPLSINANMAGITSFF